MSIDLIHLKYHAEQVTQGVSILSRFVFFILTILTTWNLAEMVGIWESVLIFSVQPNSNVKCHTVFIGLMFVMENGTVLWEKMNCMIPYVEQQRLVLTCSDVIKSLVPVSTLEMFVMLIMTV